MPTRVCRGAWVFRAYTGDQLQPRAHGSLGFVFVSLGVAEVDQHAIAHVFGHEPSQALHGLCYALLIGRNDLAKILRVHSRRECRRADEVREHDCDLATLGPVLGSNARSSRHGGFVSGGRLGCPIGAQSSDSTEELKAMPDCCDAKLLQGLVR
jgi:hypothetical protein